MLISPNEKLCRQVAHSKAVEINVALEFLLAEEMTSKSLQKIKTWLTKAPVLEDSVSIEARINTALFSPERENRVKIEPKVGAQIHSDYREEGQMLGINQLTDLYQKKNLPRIQRNLRCLAQIQPIRHHLQA